MWVKSISVTITSQPFKMEAILLSDFHPSPGAASPGAAVRSLVPTEISWLRACSRPEPICICKDACKRKESVRLKLVFSTVREKDTMGCHLAPPSLDHNSPPLQAALEPLCSFLRRSLEPGPTTPFPARPGWGEAPGREAGGFPPACRGGDME